MYLGARTDRPTDRPTYRPTYLPTDRPTDRPTYLEVVDDRDIPRRRRIVVAGCVTHAGRSVSHTTAAAIEGLLKRAPVKHRARMAGSGECSCVCGRHPTKDSDTIAFPLIDPFRAEMCGLWRPSDSRPISHEISVEGSCTTRLPCPVPECDYN